MEDFWSQVTKTPGCWFWTGSVNQKGYGIYRKGKDRTIKNAHRVSYEDSIGEVPEGLELDHLCRVKLCVNPEHLQAVDHKTNTRRGARFIDGSSKNYNLHKRYLLYIHEPRFKDEVKKSRLVNKLLEQYYSSDGDLSITPKIKPKTTEEIFGLKPEPLVESIPDTKPITYKKTQNWGA